jgi:membrane protein
MKRYLNWVLAGLATLTAIAAVRPRAETVATVAQAEPGPVVDRRPRWFDEPLSVAKAVTLRLREHHMPIIAGSLSYYAFLAIFPAAIAVISIYGLVLDPADLATQITSISDALPKETADFISVQLTAVVESSGSGLGVAAVVSIIAALWSASAGTKALITGIDIAYETPEDRPFIVLRGMSLVITIGLIIFVGAAASAVTFLPDLLDAIGAEGLTRFVEYGRWPTIFVLVIGGLGLLYKIAPNRPVSKSPWISVGALAVAFLWLLATVGFSAYANNAGSLGATYGALSGIIALLLWFFMSGLIVLLGAELNAELEARNLAHRHVKAGRG